MFDFALDGQLGGQCGGLSLIGQGSQEDFLWSFQYHIIDNKSP